MMILPQLMIRGTRMLTTEIKGIAIADGSSGPRKR
jgi:hypothetical protein